MLTEKADIKRDLRRLLTVDLYRQGVLGFCAYTAAIGAFSYWAPTFLFKRYGLALNVANFRFGVITVVAGALATAIGGKWADNIRRKVASEHGPDAVERETVRGLLRICALGSAIGAPLAVACFLAPSPGVFFVLVFFCILALFLGTSPINAVVLRACLPRSARARWRSRSSPSICSAISGRSRSSASHRPLPGRARDDDPAHRGGGERAASGGRRKSARA